MQTIKVGNYQALLGLLKTNCQYKKHHIERMIEMYIISSQRSQNNKGNTRKTGSIIQEYTTKSNDSKSNNVKSQYKKRHTVIDNIHNKRDTLKIGDVVVVNKQPPVIVISFSTNKKQHRYNDFKKQSISITTIDKNNNQSTYLVEEIKHDHQPCPFCNFKVVAHDVTATQ